jgi:hypothetical protein
MRRIGVLLPRAADDAAYQTRILGGLQLERIPVT